MATPGSSTWTNQFYGPGWPNCTTDNKVSIEFCGRSVLIHRGCAPHFRRLALALGQQSPSYAARLASRDDTGTYACRSIAGTSVPSNHSFGTAIDILWQENARDGDGTYLDSSIWNDARPFILRAEELGFRWGGRYSEPDPMHFETLLTPAQIEARFREDGSDKSKPKKFKIVAKKVKVHVAHGWDQAKKRAKRLRQRKFKVRIKKGAR